ncbi:hypothetical protein KIW84_043862 [Lathyrus oleraceus]|uniref:Uncharacterized protein n=1 Tax=Pisum sativum TaxID=3888 RepID=A0A9D4XGF3_PEA|nr:hypothetical protein KIW84_043862 [Pisum sativum]
MTPLIIHALFPLQTLMSTESTSWDKLFMTCDALGWEIQWLWRFGLASICFCNRVSKQDDACKTFHEFWFEEPSASQTQVFEDGSTVPLEVAKKTEQIVEMLKRLPNNQLLVTIIKRNLTLDFFTAICKSNWGQPIVPCNSA